MTMRITVKNEDQSRTAVIRQIDFNPNEIDVTKRIETTAGVNDVPPGESFDVWIHSGRKIEVTEKP